MARVGELGRSVSAPAHDALAEELQRTKELVGIRLVTICYSSSAAFQKQL